MKKLIPLLLAMAMTLSLCACGEKKTEDTKGDGGRTTVEIDEGIDSVVEEANKSVAALPLNKDSWDFYGALVEEDDGDTVYCVYLIAKKSFDTTLKMIWTDTEITTTGKMAYNSVVDLFDGTGVGVYVVFEDSKENMLYGYNGEEVTHLD